MNKTQLNTLSTALSRLREDECQKLALLIDAEVIDAREVRQLLGFIDPDAAPAERETDSGNKE